MKTFGNLLTEIVSSYKNVETKESLREYALREKFVNSLYKSCEAHDIRISKDDIKKFLYTLFKDDPNGNKFKKNTKKIIEPEYKENRDEGTPLMQTYFGLPFCPWCMRQLPPFIPNNQTEPDLTKHDKHKERLKKFNSIYIDKNYINSI